MAESPLTPTQRIAAARLAAGEQIKDVAGELGFNPQTVGRWQKRDDFKALMRHHRQALLPETATAESVLTSALSAVRANGSPDWQNRIAAARALLSAPVASEGAQEAARRTERIYVAPDDEGEGEG